MAAFRAEQERLRTYFKARAEISATNKAINFFLKPYKAKFAADSEAIELTQKRAKINESLTGIKEKYLESAKADKVKGTNTPVSDAVASLRSHVGDLRKAAGEAMQQLEKGLAE